MRATGRRLRLTQIGESAESLFDLARLSKWHDAAAAVQDLKESASALPSVGLEPEDLDAQLKSRIPDLEGSVTARQRVQSMDLANSITRLVADLSAPNQAEIPYKIVLLGYYGRQLELGLVASHPSTIKRATADLGQTWRSVERSVLQHGDVDDARRFTDIVVQIEGAQRPADLVAPVRAELAAVDRLKKNLYTVGAHETPPQRPLRSQRQEDEAQGSGVSQRINTLQDAE